MKKLITILILSVILAGCGTVFFPEDTARTDKVTFNVRVSSVSRDQLDIMCGRHANGCTRYNDNGKPTVFVTGYPAGLRNREITIQFRSWNQIPKDCGGIFMGTNSCLKDGVIFAYDFGYYDVGNIWASDTITARSEAGVLGAAFAEVFGYPEKQFNYEQVLAHELMAHVIPIEIEE